MTITINTDCSQATLTSEILLALNTANTLTVTYKGTSYTVAVPTGITSFTLLPEHLAMEGVFSSGVYSLKFTNTLISSSVQTDTGCAVVLCDLKCADATLSWYSDKKDITKVLYYEALKAAQDCPTCNCTLLETLFNTITTDESISCTNCCCQM